eukprot:14956655-Alexandrium_andersonii.AAC.1
MADTPPQEGRQRAKGTNKEQPRCVCESCQAPCLNCQGACCESCQMCAKNNSRMFKVLPRCVLRVLPKVCACVPRTTHACSKPCQGACCESC